MNDYGALADYYDYDHAVDFDVPFYRRYARRCGSPVLDLGCGTGRLVIPLAEEGFEVHGVDISAEMLAVCRRAVDERELAAHVFLTEADMAAFDLPRKDFGLVIVALRSFMHLLTPQAQSACLDCAAAHLKPHGMLLIDVIAAEGESLKRETGEPFVRRREFDLPSGRRVVRRDRLVAHDRLNQVRHFEFLFEEYDEDGFLAARRLVPLATRYIHRHEMQTLLEAAGFEVVNLYRNFYGQPYDGQGEMIVVARRR